MRVHLTRLHPGVDVTSDGIRDVATRRCCARPAPERWDEEIVASGLGRAPATGGNRVVLLLAAVRRRSVAPLAAISIGFRRRWPEASTPAVVLAVAGAARLPLVAMVLLFGLPAGVLAAVFGDLPLLGGAAATAVLVFWVSLVAHESAHLVVLRRVERDQLAGAVAHSWTAVWIVAPRLAPARGRIVALAGPAAGSLTAAAAGFVGATAWICAAAVVVHLASLLPTAPDGRVLFGPSHPAGVGSDRSVEVLRRRLRRERW